MHSCQNCLLILPLQDSSESLHTAGWTTLSSLPDWEMLQMCEAYHERFADHIITLLKEREDQWMEVDENDGQQRVGSAVAKEINKHVQKHGVYVTCTHTSCEQGGDWEMTGPRW